MEILIRKALVSFMVENSLITPNQFGFVAEKSTLLKLLQCAGDWMEALNKDAQTEVIFVDFRKAFDTVSHVKLLHKLKSYGIRDPLLS